MAFYLLTRLPGLTRLPVFIDEAAHIYWAGHALAGGWMDGKWLSIVIMAGAVRGLPVDSLLAARLGTVALNLGSLLLLVGIGRRLGTRRAGLLAGLFYVLLPYAFFYDRLALTDHSMILFALLAVWFSLLLVEKPRPLIAGGVTLALIAAMLAKLTGAMFAAIPVLAVGLLVPPCQWKRYLLPLAIPLFSVALVYGALYVQAFGEAQYGDKLAASGFSAVLMANSRVILQWVWTMFTPPLALLALVAAGWSVVRRQRQDVFLLALLVLGVLPFAVGAGELYPRYILFALGPAAVLSGRFLAAAERGMTARIAVHPARVAVLAGAVVLLAVWPLALQARIAADPASAPVPERIRWQYVTGLPSGTGLAELAAFLQEQAAATPGGLAVVRFPYLSPVNVGLDVLLAPSDTLSLLTVVHQELHFAEQLELIRKEQRTVLLLAPPVEERYLAVVGESMPGLLSTAELIWEYPKPVDGSSLQVWAFEP